MTLKEQAIKKAYGEYYSPDDIDENGWTDNASKDLVKNIPCDFKQMHVVYGSMSDWVRPISLRGLENNRGWISVKERLPETFYEECWLYVNGDILIGLWNDSDRCWDDEQGLILPHISNVTHWQPVVKPEAPLY